MYCSLICYTRNKEKSSHLLNAYYVPGTAPSPLHVLYRVLLHVLYHLQYSICKDHCCYSTVQRKKLRSREVK